MSRPIQSGDYVRAFFPDGDKLYQIVYIQNSNILISPMDSGNKATNVIYLNNEGEWVILHYEDVPFEFFTTELSENILTGNQNADTLILSNLPDDTLKVVCLIDQYTKQLCESNKLWLTKIEQNFGEVAIQDWRTRLFDLDPKTFYYELTSLDPIIAGKRGYYYLVDQLINAHQPFPKEALDWAVYYSNYEFLDKFANKNLLPNNYMANYAAGQGDIEMLTWLEAHQILPSRIGIDAAAINNQLNAIKWLAERNLFIDDHGVLRTAQLGHLEILKYSFEMGVSMAHLTENYNAINNYGDVPVLEWMNLLGLKLNSQITYTYLEWLAYHENYSELSEIAKQGFVPNRSIANWAAGNNKLELLEWLSNHGVLPNHSGVNYAGFNGHIEILKWLAQREILPTQDGVNKIATRRLISVLDWLAERDLFPSVNRYRITRSYGQLEVLEWMRAKQIVPED